jgi:hypothetical protein
MDELLDRAREWVNENYPDLQGEAYTSKLQEAIDDLAAIDCHNDELGPVMYLNPIS